MLLKHKQSLKILFQGLVEAEPLLGPSGSSLLTHRCFQAFIRAAGFIGADMSERESTYCFLWSIMAVVDGQSRGGRLRESCLPFEGFLEALCRVAAFKVLPTDAEISQSGCLDAAACVHHMRKKDAVGYARMLKERAKIWGELPQQPVHRCVDHLIHIILRSIEGSEGGKESDGGAVELDPRLFKKWRKTNLVFR